MATQFPAKIDDNITLPAVIDNASPVRASSMNELRSAIIAVESALGVNPASVYGTVKERLAAIDAILESIRAKEVIFEGDIDDIKDRLAAIDILIENLIANQVDFNGDLDGSSISQSVVGLRGNSISSEAPSDGYVLTWNAGTNNWKPLPASGASVVSVADDIAKSAGTAIDRVRGFNGRSLETTDVPGRGDVYLYRIADGKFRSGRSCPPGWYDPRDYGAKLNGNSAQAWDDLAAFQAMLADIPTTGGYIHMDGVAWLSDTLRISKPVQFFGTGGAGVVGSNIRAGFRVAPGKTALRFDGPTISLDGNSAANAYLFGVDLVSRMLIHGTAGGSSLGKGIDTTYTTDDVRLGDCRIASGGAHSTKFFRATAITANGGRGPGKMTSGEPSWNTTVGGTTTLDGITWTCEKFPTVRADNTAYSVGDRVYANKDNRYIFECTVGGTSSGTAPSQMAGGDDAPGVELGGTFTDGTVTWKTTMASGIIMAATTTKTEFVYITGFTNCAIYNAGGTGMFVEAAESDANACRFQHIYAEYCGMGFAVAGLNTNGWSLRDFFVINMGTLQPTPNAASAASYTNLGGHCVHDKSLAGGTIDNIHSQLSTGRPILKNGPGRTTVIHGMQEIDQPSLCSLGNVILFGGSMYFSNDSTGVCHLDPGSYGRGIGVYDATGAKYIRASLGSYDGKSLYKLEAENTGGSPNAYAWRYGNANTPTGWWGFNSWPQTEQTAFAVSDIDAGLDPGLGWLTTYRGHLVGAAAATMLFRGAYSQLTNRELRGGLRRAGDIFEDSTRRVTVLANGYRGIPWTANTTVAADYTPWAIPAYVVEPTTNTGRYSGGEQVWKCTTGGTTHATTEPVWPGSPTVGVTTITDGTVVWTYLGTTPTVDVEQITDKASIPVRLTVTQTTTATAAQVIESGGVVNGIDFMLPPDSMTTIVDVITVKKASTADGGSIRVESTWVRNGTGAPAEIGTGSANPTYNLSGTTLDGTTVTHAANGNRIELRASPESADTLNWRVFRTQTTGRD